MQYVSILDQPTLAKPHSNLAKPHSNRPWLLNSVIVATMRENDCTANGGNGIMLPCHWNEKLHMSGYRISQLLRARVTASSLRLCRPTSCDMPPCYLSPSTHQRVVAVTIETYLFVVRGMCSACGAVGSASVS